MSVPTQGDDGAWLEAQYRQAEITGLDAHVEHTVKVLATNDHYGYGQAAAAKSTPSGTGGLDEPVQNLAVAADEQATGSAIGLVVSWEPPSGDSADDIARYAVQWRLSDGDYDAETRQAIVAATSATAYTLIIGDQSANANSDGSITRADADLVHGEHYEVRVLPASGSSQGPPTAASAQAFKAAELLREFIKDDIVDEYESEWPWVAQIWDTVASITTVSRISESSSSYLCRTNTEAEADPVGAGNSVVAGQAACRYSLTSPSHRVDFTASRCWRGWFGGSGGSGGRWASERWGRWVR